MNDPSQHKVSAAEISVPLPAIGTPLRAQTLLADAGLATTAFPGLPSSSGSPVVVTGPTVFVPSALPDKATAVLLDFFDPTVGQTAELASMLRARGYQTVVKPLTLAALRTVFDEPVGILYICGHGGYENTVNTPPPATDGGTSASPPTDWYIALPTLDEVNLVDLTPEAAARDADIAAKRVVSTTVELFTRGPDGKIIQTPGTQPEERWAATLEFFRFYWGNGTRVFADRSLVFFNTCYNGGAADYALFRDVLKSAGAGMYLSWTNKTVGSECVSTANYIFDRMLGANHSGPEYFPDTIMLPRRPYDWAVLATDMKNYQEPRSHQTLGSQNITDPSTGLNLHSELLHDEIAGLTHLTSSIIRMDIDEPGQRLVITGVFGPDLGSSRRVVTLSPSTDPSSPATALEVSSWDPTQIVCALPPATASGPTGASSGYLVVTVDGRSSNCVPITEWRGQLVAVAKGEQSLQSTCTINFSIRGDIHLCRMDWFSLPSPNSFLSPALFFTAGVSRTSQCLYAANGSDSRTDPDGGGVTTQSVTGGGSVAPASIDPNGALRAGIDLFDLNVRIMQRLDYHLQAARDIQLVLRLPTAPPFTVSWTRSSPNNAPTTSDESALAWVTLGNQPMLANAPSFDLPDPNIFEDYRNDNSAQWKTIQVNITASTLQPPEPSRGEDYRPALNSSG